MLRGVCKMCSIGISYRGLAKKYNNFHGQPINYFDLQLDKIIKYLNMNREGRYLDVGCGAGRLMVPLIKRGSFHIEGLDNSEAMIEQCRKETVSPLKLYTTFFKDFKPTKKYDGIYFSMSLHQMNNQIGMIKKALKMLKNNGKILLITVNHKQFEEILLNKFSPTLDSVDRNRFLDVSELKKIGNKLGIVESIEEHTIYQQIPKKRFIDMVENKYISSLQLISPNEVNSIVKQIKRIKGNIITVPDCYTYVVVGKK
jgi:2-polyprenyl-3-methyl-5-hydroxy-6-metoxy-1,4-benzoquinol methylase